MNTGADAVAPVEVVLAFGANLGDRGATIRAAQREIAASAGILSFEASPLRETIAMTLTGPDPEAPRYINGVARLTTTLEPLALLDLVQRIETAHGRVRDVRWGDRTLDIDVITYGDQVSADERLEVPHPRAHVRDFVLSPWALLDASASIPGRGSVAALLAQTGDTTSPLDETMTDSLTEEA